MAVIQKIRDKYAKLAGFVIALALVGFLLMDAGDNLRKIFTGGDYIAKVNGDKIEPREYAERIEEYQSLYELMGNKMDDNTRAQIHDQVLKEMIYEKVIASEMEDLGLTITKEEEKEMISGPNPDPLVMQFPLFRNQETGQFDPNYLRAFEKKELPSSPEAQKALEQWEMMKNYIRRTHLVQKYNSLFGAAAYSPKFIMDRQAKDQGYLASIRFVKIPLSAVNDNEVKITDADLKSYMEKHPAQYRIEDPTRSIEYVSFDVAPSPQDTARSLTALSQLKNEFSTTSDVESFVNRNSDEQYTSAYVTKKSFMSAYADSILKQPAGTVFGPYFENNSYKLTKVEAKTTLPDSVKLRHILIKSKDRGNDVVVDSIAKRRIDSIEVAIKSGADFKQMVDKYSDDPGSKATAGEYTFTLQQRPQLSKEFADFVFDGKTGEKKVVKVENDNYSGYHYIEVLEQKDIQPAAKLATVTKSLFPSEETNQAAYAKANEFAGRNSNAKGFDEAVKKQNLTKLQAQNVKVNDFVMPGLGSSREIIRWMYEAKVGDVSPVFTMEGRYVIAKLTGIQEEGLMQLDESNRPAIEAVVRARKKADIIANKYKDMTSIDAVAQASAQPIQNVDSFNASSSFIPNLGFEPKVVGYSFYDGFKPNATSPAIKGQDGVFFISLKLRQQNAANIDPMALQQQQMQQMQMKNSISGMMQETVRKNADIKYSAKNLY
jgi:peptidyl-prolyl cis-trans isomerase D